MGENERIWILLTERLNGHKIEVGWKWRGSELGELSARNKKGSGKIDNFNEGGEIYYLKRLANKQCCR